MIDDLIRILQCPARLDALEARVSELTDAYEQMSAAVNEAVSELTDLASQVDALKGETGPVAAKMRALADRLSGAYQAAPKE